MATGQPAGTSLFVGAGYIYRLPVLPARLVSRRRGDQRSAAWVDYLFVRGQRSQVTGQPLASAVIPRDEGSCNVNLLVLNYFSITVSLCPIPPQLENTIQKSMKQEVAGIPSQVVHNQTAAMLEMGTHLLTHTAEQTRKLSVVEAKVRRLPPCRHSGS